MTIFILTINNTIISKEKENIVFRVQGNDKEQLKIKKEEKREIISIKPQCIMILGCGIIDYNSPSPMMKDRLDTGIAMYKQGIAPKILLTGDNGTVSHNEIHVMLQYAKNAGVPKEDIFCDHAGFSTYDSVYRAKKIFRVKSMVVVTQTYHMYRALYISNQMGVSAKGVASDQVNYRGQKKRDMREVLARVKDYFKIKGNKKSLLGGEEIPITGSGISSHGE